MKISKDEQKGLEIYEAEYQKTLETKKRDVKAMRLAIVKGILNINKKIKE